MMPDRYLDAKARGPLARPKVKNPYSALRAPVAEPDPGQVQPDFAGMSGPSMDPMEQVPPQMSRALMGMPTMRPGAPGSEDVRTDKYSQDLGRGKNLNVYQSPLEYETNLNTVRNTPEMQGLSQGVDRMRQLREDFLKTAPAQTDLSPVMALADYVAKGRGTAQSGYTKPANYEALVSDLSGMLGNEQKARQNQAQLEMEQTGGLRKGTEEAQVKTSSDLGRQQGYKIPHPFMGGIQMPFTQGQAIAGSYEKVAKDANDTIKNALDTRKLLANPSWYTSNALKGAIVRGIGVNRITQNELFLLGGGSQDLISQVDRAFQKAATGDGLLQSDRHAIETYNELTLKGAIAKREQIKQQMTQGYSGITVLPGQKVGEVMSGRDTPVSGQDASGGGDSEAARAQAFAAQFMNLMKGGK